MRSLLDIADLGSDDILQILALSERGDLGRPLAGRGVALLFAKSSARTRNSMEMAVVQLGGHPVTIRKDEVGVGTRETAEDVARTLACYHALIAARVVDHRDLERMAAAVETPVLNMLSDRSHPLQALADLLTVRQLRGTLDGASIAYVGDANNVARSLGQACATLGLEFRIAAPGGYGFNDAEVSALGAVQSDDPAAAVAGADVVYTDVWTSMGQEAEEETRRRDFARFRVDETLMAQAPDAWFLHCLPARRGEEVTDGVMDGPRSAIWRQAENRMHTARGAMAWMLSA